MMDQEAEENNESILIKYKLIKEKKVEPPNEKFVNDPRLNFLSSSFDPLIALYSPQAQPPQIDAPSFPSLSKAEFLLPFHLQRSLRGSNQSISFRDASPSSQVRIIRNKELRHHLRCKILIKRTSEKVAVAKEIDSLTHATSPVQLPLECCTHKGILITICLSSLKKRSLHLKYLKGIPLLFTSNWDILLDIPSTNSLVWVQGSEILYITYNM